MVKPIFNKDHKDTLDSILLKLPEVKEGKMFGFPAYHIHGKLFACILEEGVCIKLPDALVQKLFKDKKVQSI
jgi:hypothetical protein